MRTLLPGIALALVFMPGKSNAPVRAAQADSNAVSFEVASIKPNKSANGGSFVGRQPGGRFGAQNATLLELIQFAYQAQPFRVMGGPDWVRSARWDVVAKLAAVPLPAPNGAPDDTLLALRALLRTRFNLVIRSETQQLSIYALVTARSDGRLGPRMSRSTVDCNALLAARRGGGSAPPAPGDRPCGLRGRVGSVQSIGAPLLEFADLLSERVQRPVIDRTGLTGTWDFTMTYAAEPSQIAPGVLAPGTQPPPADPNAPSLFTALQEQLGLKLESARGAVEVLVVERAERPAED
jgi:uncharacterized protein (TIGR03435 family)